MPLEKPQQSATGKWFYTVEEIVQTKAVILLLVHEQVDYLHGILCLEFKGSRNGKALVLLI